MRVVLKIGQRLGKKRFMINLRQEDPLDELVKEEVERSVRQALRSIAVEAGRVGRRHLAAAGTGVSAGVAVWTYPVIAVPVSITVLTYWMIASR
jgi:hypothetical protein